MRNQNLQRRTASQRDRDRVGRASVEQNDFAVLIDSDFRVKNASFEAVDEDVDEGAAERFDRLSDEFVRQRTRTRNAAASAVDRRRFEEADRQRKFATAVKFAEENGLRRLIFANGDARRRDFQGLR